ncbi:hypothetical protein [Parasphaerochaeta coccoides]|uniref:Uncharacterized protein n=1 Tax=Parasphaerochaeta coccoides (strain ATCC BAA-1237 / DSM 17374 / SPN1) TaxID=760011 RepID=F4GKM4_PARC1|nr:hypothetical protein [Parasphaerochaeta coccoides]AEC01433.1 hypothetical protein Spico_0197 [Parasphaerochaeta coccoides DSM 17374]
MSSYVDKGLIVDFPMPEGLREKVDRLESLADGDDYLAYENLLEEVDTTAKRYCAGGKITYEQYQTILRKFGI